jgi:hypothetical protein
MKTLLLLLLLPGMCLSQRLKKEANEPFKRANIIIVESPMPDSETFRIAGQTLVSEGMPIQSSDNNFFVITTGLFNPRNNTFQMKLNVTIMDKRVILRGESYNNSYSFGMYNFGNSTVPSKTFDFVNDYAISLSNRLKGAGEASGIGSSRIIYGIEE